MGAVSAISSVQSQPLEALKEGGFPKVQAQQPHALLKDSFKLSSAVAPKTPNAAPAA